MTTKEALDFAKAKLTDAWIVLNEFDASYKVYDIAYDRRRFILVQAVIDATKDLTEVLNQYIHERLK